MAGSKRLVDINESQVAGTKTSTVKMNILVRTCVWQFFRRISLAS